jgi:hypothetical protein
MNAGTATPTVREPRVRRLPVDGIVIAVLALLSVAVTAVAVRGPGHVPRLTVVNPHDYTFEVSVGDGPDAGRLTVGTVRRGSTATIAEVLDQGDTWVVAFSAAGTDAGEVTIERRRLQAEDWTVVVPDQAAERLRSLGVPPSSQFG